ncbi:hypothetical protein Sango_2663200 [Sesamum angolense]|uniref:DUF7722 domain-containing protein n=1 Tax=Sesamum angolense TaxID=2727404 RepID=A0AAE1W283_9LAMI|nr:hypothetical protein Sango_2663200 [Sesamum angolense]
MGSKERRSEFQMPLHYPKYSRKEYQDMPEWALDRLLADYGLPADGDLAQKRRFAMGAFLWPDNNNGVEAAASLRKKNV